jgi:hypothetical protein
MGVDVGRCHLLGSRASFRELFPAPKRGLEMGADADKCSVIIFFNYLLLIPLGSYTDLERPPCSSL